MQRTVTASLKFIDFSLDKKPPVGDDMVQGLENFSNLFPNPPMKAPDLKLLNQDFSAAAAGARTGEKTAVAKLVNVEKKWDIAFRGQAKYVGYVANGNNEVILQGGCTPTSSESNPLQAPGTCNGVKVESGPGNNTITIGCESDTDAKGHLFAAHVKGVTFRQDGDVIIVEKDGESIAFFVADTHRKVMFHNLPGDVRVFATMLAFNNAGCGPLSAEQGVMPQ